MSRTGSQSRTLLELAARLRPHWRGDPAFAERLDRLLSGDRRLGSRDRRLYRELAYAAVRHLPWVEPRLDRDPDEFVRRTAWLAADTPATRAFREEAAAGLPPCPPGAAGRAAILGEDPAALEPAWFAAECARAGDSRLRDCLLARAPLWVRLQGPAEATVLGEFEALGWAWSRSDRVPGAVRLPPDAAVAATTAYRSGWIEIQDAGSQRILATARIRPDEHWLDACAGAGGKAIQLAGLLGPGGSVDAHDIRPAALEELRARAGRAGLGDRVRILREAPAPAGDGSRAGAYDGVLVDAPCSGSGTWRRSPHLKWSTTRDSIRRAADLQGELLGRFAVCVRPGGRLVYATCSLGRTENEGVARRFLESNGDFETEAESKDGRAGNESVPPGGAGATLWPDEHDGDGYFVACFRRKSTGARNQSSPTTP